LLIARSLLGLAPDLPHERLAVDPQLPDGRHLGIAALPLGPHRINITSDGGPARVQGLPAGVIIGPPLRVSDQES
jgi:hypothetical protein